MYGIQLKVDDGTLINGIGYFIPGNVVKDSVSLDSKNVFSYGTGILLLQNYKLNTHSFYAVCFLFFIIFYFKSSASYSTTFFIISTADFWSSNAFNTSKILSDQPAIRYTSFFLTSKGCLP